MSNHSRAVYIPPAKRKRQTQQRFHGAFTGGFSAGYFNTVDTKEGWKPSIEKRRQQRLEDFMDDQDHQEWGGPTTVRQEFKDDKDNERTSATAPLELDAFFRVTRPLTVGLRLLRHLGWREGTGAAFVPDTTDTDQRTSKEKEDANISKIHLSKKKLRQIELQSSRIQLPPPKLDLCGLGFEAHDNAPEFKQYRQQRQEMAKLRARGQANVYRVANVLGVGTSQSGIQQTLLAEPGDYVSYEAPEDFVGTHSASGFALRDDEDDVYDPQSLQGDRNNNDDDNGRASASSRENMRSQEYNTEIVDIDEDSDIEDSSTPLPGVKKSIKVHSSTTRTNELLGDVLASWAGKNELDVKPTSSSIPSSSLTSSGRPPIEGFRLGGSMESHKKRYAGPDLPRDYQPTRHSFGANERPAIFETIGRALQIEEKQQHHSREADKRPTIPLFGNNQFATLATAMKNRFTSGSVSASDPALQPISIPPGLYRPSLVTPKEEGKEFDVPPSSTSTLSKPIVIRRTTTTFAPNPLLCKRFGVDVPRLAVQTSNSNPPARTTEATYFETEVLPTAREAALSNSDAHRLYYDSNPNSSSVQLEEKGDEQPTTEIARPSREKLKAIFEPDSDDASTTSADTDLDSGEENNGAKEEKTRIIPSRDDMQVVVHESSNNREENIDQCGLVAYIERKQVAGNSKSELSSDNDVDNSSSEDTSSYRRRKRKRSDKSRSKRKKKKRIAHSRRDHDSFHENVSSDSSGKGKKRKREKTEKSRKHGKKRSRKRASRSD